MNRNREKRWPLDLEIGARRGNGARDLDVFPMLTAVKLDMAVVNGLSGELNFQIRADRRRSQFRLREAGAHNHHRELRAPHHL